MPSDSLNIEDPQQLLAWLRLSKRIDPSETPQITLLSGGVSNRAVLLRRCSGESWVLKQALPRLRVSVEWLSDPRRIEREAAGMQRLVELAPAGAIPTLLFIEPAEHLLAMTAVPQPHQNWKTMLLAGDLRQNHVQQFATLLGTIHRRGWEMKSVLEQEFVDRSFFESLRLEPYYLYAAEHMPAAREFLGDLVAQTRATRQTFVHGDFSPKNILVFEDRLILLDHEVVHFGDPAFDLGFSMCHLLSKANFLVEHRSNFAQAAHQYWRTYLATTEGLPWRRELEPRAVAHTLACLLARCIGRSPLEYLPPAVAARQANAASAMMLSHARPGMDVAIEEFLNRLG